MYCKHYFTDGVNLSKNESDDHEGGISRWTCDKCGLVNYSRGYFLTEEQWAIVFRVDPRSR